MIILRLMRASNRIYFTKRFARSSTFAALIFCTSGSIPLSARAWWVPYWWRSISLPCLPLNRCSELSFVAEVRSRPDPTPVTNSETSVDQYNLRAELARDVVCDKSAPKLEGKQRVSPISTLNCGTSAKREISSNSI
ncbi:hypothetical protein Trydic_g16150 [Trypoxylus dichotomus]